MTLDDHPEGRTLHLLVPNIESRSGHNYHQILELHRAATTRGLACRTHVPRQIADASLIAELGAERSLDHVRIREFADPVAEIGAANYRFYQDVDQLPPPRPGDLLFLLAAHHRNVYGFMKAIDRRLADGASFAFAALLWSQECYASADGEIHRRNSDIFGRFLIWCQERPLYCRALFAFSAAHLDHLHSLPGVRAELLPFPFIVPRIPVPALPTRLPNTCRFGYFGLSWWDQKGLGVFMSALRTVLANNPEATATLQINTSGATYNAESLLAAHADVLESNRVSCLRGDLETDIYMRELAACDVIVLPYGPAYDRQESGILHEAAAWGCAVVLPESSLANARLKAVNVVTMPTFDRWTPDAIAAACQRAIPIRVPLGRTMQRAADALNGNFTAERLLDHLGLS
ncbi:hypothetical protein GBZ48_19195 [Azospirillum melinis]|uniref:Glycosyltransferase n=1 Tax=Azospirillum melinis TaxID=328839 RepID=A0ABX2KNI9_9PROT|nr:hypothetical protein [Azospirillum melinis]MBP2307297.1 hypothetical protein [Azospirillum melinis]NUB01389.1 hypothetical protein [Azospirillum melinis]